MKKLLALLLALAMVMSFAACASQETEPTSAPTEEPTQAPTEEETIPVPEFRQYKYVEDRGDFTVTWTFTVMGELYSLQEENGMSGGNDTHPVTTFVDNGDGTITTGPWEDQDSNKSDFFEADGSCTWIVNDDGTFEPVNAGESSSSEGSVNPGQYTYVDGDTTWVIKIMGNGSCVIDETDTATGDVINEHTTRESDTGKGWTDNGNGTFETNEWEPEEREDNKVALASPNGVTTWKVVDAENGLVEPTEAVEEQTAIAYGAYHYTDAEGNLYAVMIMGNGDCTIQPNDADGNIIMREEGGPVEYKTDGFVINEDGTFTTLAITDQSDIPSFLEGDGTATWRIVDAENMIVELVTE